MQRIIFSLFVLMTLSSCNGYAQKNKDTNVQQSNDVEMTTFTTSSGTIVERVLLPEVEWQNRLSEMEYYVIRKKGTERAFTGKLLDNKKDGIYSCRACQMPLFDSKTKYNSGTGWPSFWQPIEESYILLDVDYDIGYARNEVMCKRCGGHLGHVFNDGPKPTGLRYCLNSVSLDFVDRKDSGQILKNF